MKRKLLILFGLILFFASINLEVRYLRGADAWLADGSTRRQKITTQVANIDGDLTWFPLYVEVVPGDTPGGATMTEAAADGTDIRFTESDGQTLLAYERVYWSGGNGSAVTAHFFVSKTGWTIDADGDPAATYIYIYYGSGGADGENVAGVWDGNFVAVWHTHDDPNTSTITDSLNALPGNKTGANQPLESASAMIYKSQDYDGSNWEIDTLHPADTDNIFDGGGTFSILLNLDNDDDNVRIADKRLPGWSTYYGYDDICFDFDFDDTDGQWNTTSNWLVVDTWFHVAITYNVDDVGNNPLCYVNGSSVAFTETSTPVGTRQSDATDELFIGNTGPAGANGWNGLLEEIRLSDSIRTEAWLNFEYHNIAEADHELTWAAEESASSGYIPKVIIITEGQ